MPYIGGLARNASVTVVCLFLANCGSETEFRGGPPVVKPVESTDATAVSEEAGATQGETKGQSDSPASTSDKPTKIVDAKVAEPPAIVDIQLPLTYYDRVVWHWECSASGDIEIFPTSDKEAVVQGAGPHGFDPEELPDSEVVLTGRLCAPQERKRDLVFVVDVSGSMLTNDPMIAGSCGRLAAIESVVANLPTDGTAQIGIATFSTDVDSSTSALFGTLAEVAADLGGSFANVICGQDGGTNYTAGMTQAAQLLSMGREDAMKELYFISDGQPNVGEDGIAEAQSLRNPGVTVGQKQIPVAIATVMLGTVDTVLEQSIASLDYNGNPLHAFANDASTLAATLAALADNQIVTAEVMYRIVGTRKWTRIDIMDHMQEFEYVLPPIKLSQSIAPGGFEIVYQYRDRHGNLFTDHGKITWQTKPRDTCQAVAGTMDCLADSGG